MKLIDSLHWKRQAIGFFFFFCGWSIQFAILRKNPPIFRPELCPWNFSFFSSYLGTQLFSNVWLLLAVLFHNGSNPFPYSLIFQVPLQVIFAVTNGLFYNFFLITFVLIPILEWMLPLDTMEEQSEEQFSPLKKHLFRLVPLSWGIFSFLFFFWSCALAVQFFPAQDQSVHGWSFFQWASFMIQVGLVNGILTINICHELIHKRYCWLDSFMGKILSVLVMYTHWAQVEHFEHHKWVGTLHDPATARSNESFYSFLKRSIVDGFWNAWKVECARLGAYSGYTPYNRVLQGQVVTFLFVLLLNHYYGWKGVLFFVGQAGFAIGMLEVTNYIEHYGLSRESHEMVKPWHSWNANQLPTNFILLNLPRHSDHHYKSDTRYQHLRANMKEGIPTLPYGYATMMILAFIPPLWFKIMGGAKPLQANTSARGTAGQSPAQE